LSISGNIAGSPIIDFNGADNVTFGRVNQTGSTRSLSITNSSSSTNAGTSTVNFSNSAELNTLKYVSVYGSSASTTDGVIKLQHLMAAHEKTHKKDIHQLSVTV
jgi:hypothetical protein